MSLAQRASAQRARPFPSLEESWAVLPEPSNAVADGEDTPKSDVRLAPADSHRGFLHVNQAGVKGGEGVWRWRVWEYVKAGSRLCTARVRR